ncbi:hypothetical protein [Faecalibacterium sp. DFI.5.82]|uniref:hypothetical protein n=1 Tax=Faecalibacterium sp. DFI.5.82 TaxID=3031725 RepID=UPI0023B1B0DE|nr:hypothetical protein [Faecalibacterium sp. DFI.5.82]MDE8690731.1 hypothetical protein [Faecalibacterium sp. DFI.5.82]
MFFVLSVWGGATGVTSLLRFIAQKSEVAGNTFFLLLVYTKRGRRGALRFVTNVFVFLVLLVLLLVKKSGFSRVFGNTHAFLNVLLWCFVGVACPYEPRPCFFHWKKIAPWMPQKFQPGKLLLLALRLSAGLRTGLRRASRPCR